LPSVIISRKNAMSQNQFLSLILGLSAIGCFYLLISQYIYEQKPIISLHLGKTSPEEFFNLWESSENHCSSTRSLMLDEESLEFQINTGFPISDTSSWSWRIEPNKLSEGRLEIYPSYVNHNYDDSERRFANQLLENEVRGFVYLQKSLYLENQSIDLDNGYEKIESITDSLQYSQIAFNSPSQMVLNEETYVILLASNYLTEKTLESKLDSIFDRQNNTDSIETHQIRSTALLEAQLTGQNFSVESGSPVRQPVFDYDVTRWDWIVQPKQEGIKFLVLTINVILDLNGKQTPFTIGTFRKEIKVTVENKFEKFYESNQTLIIWFLSTGFTFGSVYFGFWLDKKKRNEVIPES
jgi:hypothetical protein